MIFLGKKDPLKDDLFKIKCFSAKLNIQVLLVIRLFLMLTILLLLLLLLFFRTAEANRTVRVRNDDVEIKNFLVYFCHAQYKCIRVRLT